MTIILMLVVFAVLLMLGAPILAAMGLGAAVVVIANLLAIAPALAASRSAPGQLLRTR